jgi:hypothetical protein
MSKKWNIKEEVNPTETIFYVRKGKHVVGLITGQHHIEGDVDESRKIAEKIVEDKIANDYAHKNIKPGMKVFSKVNIVGGIHMDDILKIKCVYYRGNGKPILEFEEVGGKYEFNKEKFELIE